MKRKHTLAAILAALMLLPTFASCAASPDEGETQASQITNNETEDGDYLKDALPNDLNYDGDTIVVGGMVESQTQTINDKIPFLGDLPFIGRFFQSRYSEAEKGNMLIFLTCRIVNPDGSAKYPEGKRPNGVAQFGKNF